MAAAAWLAFIADPTVNTIITVPYQPEPTFHLKVEAYCILCDTKLSKWQTIQERDASPHAGHADVLCFFRLPDPITTTEVPNTQSQSSASEPSRVKVIQIKYGLSNWVDRGTPLRELVTRSGLEICELEQTCDSCDRSSPANFVHLACYKVAKQILPDLLVEDLWRFARLTRPISLEDFLPRSPAPVSPRSMAHFSSLPLNGETELGQLIAEIRNRLPLELERIILDRPHRLFRSLTKCIDIVCSHREFLRHQPLPEHEFEAQGPFQMIWNPTILGVTTMSIMGQTCITAIGANTTRTWDLEIQLPADTTTIAGIQTAYGTFGVMALRVLYKDGSLSPWVGELPRFRRRFQTTRGPLQRLRTLSDGFKLVSVKILPDEEQGDPQFALMWNEDALPARGYTYTLLDTREVYLNEMGHYGFRTGLCLSLQELRSLTFFSGPGGLSSIQSQGAEIQRRGLKMTTTVARTFFFSPGEYIRTIWMIREKLHPIMHQLMDWGPHLLMITSTGRHQFSGPQEVLATRRFVVTRLDQYGQRQRRPVALFVDPTTAYFRALRSIGAVFEGESENERTELDPDDWIEIALPMKPGNNIPTLPLDGANSTFLTTANLSSVTCLKKQMRRGRCVGLYIERDPRYEDAPQVLGQWDPAETKGISTIYSADSSESKPVEALTFVFRDDSEPNAPGRRCIDVKVGRHESIPQPRFICDKFPQQLSWWFNRRGDLIEPWTGSTKTFDTKTGTGTGMETDAILVS